MQCVHTITNFCCLSFFQDLFLGSGLAICGNLLISVSLNVQVCTENVLYKKDIKKKMRERETETDAETEQKQRQNYDDID